MIKSQAKKFLVNYFPHLGKLKRFVFALWNHITPIKTTYAQHQEDLLILELLEKLKTKINIENSLYVDVGANHPSDISNTYLLYRNGYRGITIEPNLELLNLHKIFRNQDIHLGIGCSETPGILEFHISKTPVLSSFTGVLPQENILATEYVPVMPIDLILDNNILKDRMVSFLNIDVEGMNFEVLQSGNKTLPFCAILCVEFDSDLEKKLISNSKLLENNFSLHKEVFCNLIYLNNLFFD